MAGRPTKYDPIKHPIEYAVLRRAGYDDAACARLMKVAPATLYNWRDKFSEFREAKAEAMDAQVVALTENALFQRARGYDVPVREVVKERVVDEKTGIETLVTTRIVEKSSHIPADVRAATLVLTNLNPDRWKVKVEHDLSGVSDEQLQLLFAAQVAAAGAGHGGAAGDAAAGVGDSGRDAGGVGGGALS
jgi:transposase-like protein